MEPQKASPKSAEERKPQASGDKLAAASVSPPRMGSPAQVVGAQSAAQAVAAIAKASKPPMMVAVLPEGRRLLVRLRVPIKAERKWVAVPHGPVADGLYAPLERMARAWAEAVAKRAAESGAPWVVRAGRGAGLPVLIVGPSGGVKAQAGPAGGEQAQALIGRLEGGQAAALWSLAEAAQSGPAFEPPAPVAPSGPSA